MHIVELRVARKGFGETLGEMRQWIDRHGADPVKFETSMEPDGHIAVRLEFARPELGLAFRRDWGIADIAAAAAA